MTSKTISAEAAAAYLLSTSAGDVVKGLNFLLSKSCETNGEVSSLTIEHHPTVLSALGDLLDVINPLAITLFSEEVSTQESAALFQYERNKFEKLLGGSNHEFQFLARYLDDNQLLLSTLGVLRNLSFEATNEVYLAYNTTIMKHLVSIVEASLFVGRPMECTQLAMETIINLGNKLEVTGAKRYQSSSGYFLDELPKDTVGAALLRLKMTAPMSAATGDLYSKILHELILVINSYLQPATAISRFFIFKTLELLEKMILLGDNSAFFSRQSALLIPTLFRLLTVQNNRSDPLVPESYAVIGDPYGRSRPPYAPSIINVPGEMPLTFFHDQMDLELRDAALSCIRPLCLFPKSMAPGVLVAQPQSVELMFQIAAFRTPVPALALRNDSSAKAISILSSLVHVPAAAVKFKSIRSEIMMAGCADHNLSEIMCNIAPHFVIPNVKAMAATQQGL